ncbi:MAG: hypothetical protein JNL69_03375 [Bacteroidia bacterium]|nr:hypothetical protein [Bacteroidia bacterium]
MIKYSNDKEDFNSLSIVYIIYKWKKPLIIVLSIALVISAIASLLIKDKYKSTTILFPATTSSISKALLTENNYKKTDILEFGEEAEAEQMLQILNSDGIRTRICEKYNLMTHYGIKENEKYKRTKLYEEYLNNITFKRTEYMSVKIEVLDHNPDTAALIANDIAALHDSTKIFIQKERANQALRIVEQEYFSKLKEIQAMEDSLKTINSFGLYDYESQSEVTSEQYAIAISKGDQRAIKSLEEKLKIIGQYGSAYVSLRDNMYMQRKQLNLLKSKFDEAKVDAQETLPQKFVVSSAYPAEKKSYPSRVLIVIVAVISTFLTSLILILIIENLKRIKLK